MRVQLSCINCGSNDFRLDEARSDDCTVTCGQCGHVVGTLGELKQRVAEEVLASAKGSPEA